MVQRYAHPQKQHIADSMKKLALANAAELAEYERCTRKTPEQVPDSGVAISAISATVPDNRANLSDSKIEGKSQQINPIN